MSGPEYTRQEFLDGKVVLYGGDNRDVLRDLPDNSIDSIVTDPPYALVSIVKRFGSPNAAPAKGNDAYMRASVGFMGKEWDGGDIAFRPETWAEVLRVLKPGGHVAAFGASRGYHRMACAIEDAGFEIRDSLLDLIDSEPMLLQFLDSLDDAQRDAFVRLVDHAMPGGTLAWLYGTGFPKSQNVSLAIDKRAGAIGHLAKSFNMKGGGDRSDEFSENGRDFSIRHEPVTDEAKQWSGFGTALKPAFEPIVLARKPLSEGTVAANVLRWGTGALNIDGCRVPSDDAIAPMSGKAILAGTSDGWDRPWKSNPDALAARQQRANEAIEKANTLGRWPANVVHDGSDEVVAAFPSNSARFFYSAKASKADRAGSKHPTVKPIALMEWLATLITPPGGTVLDPFAGSGTTGAAARNKGFNCVLIEREAEYVEDIKRRLSAPIVAAAVAAQQPANDNEPAVDQPADLFSRLSA